MGCHLSTLERGCKYTRYTGVGLWLWILKKVREALSLAEHKFECKPILNTRATTAWAERRKVGCGKRLATGRRS